MLAGLALTAVLLLAPAATWAQADTGYHDPDDPATEAAAREALSRAEIRRITPEVRSIAGVQTVVRGEVLTLESARRDLASGGLETRLGAEGLEVLLPGDVLFDFDKSAIRQDALPTLEKVASVATRIGGAPIRVEGHTDQVGTAAYNQRLSEARASAVADWLKQRGVAAARLSAKGFGATRPVAPNRTAAGKDDPAGRQKNRRVTVIFSR